MTMKMNTTEPEEKKEQKKDTELYTIIDRYINLCQQAQLDSGRIYWDDRYINCWFPY